MPKHATDFSKTKIYKIVCKDLSVNEIYVGHTTDFTRRKCKHKQDCNKETAKNYNTKVYKTIRENGGWENWDMVFIEDYPCTNKFEASARERYYYELLKGSGSLNTNVPGRTVKEYYQDNIQQFKEYYQENKDKLLEYQNNYNLVNKDKIKEYREKNKDKIRERACEYRADYYKNNIDKFKERAHQEFECECGGRYTYGGKSTHFKTKKHIKYLANQNNNEV